MHHLTSPTVAVMVSQPIVGRQMCVFPVDAAAAEACYLHDITLSCYCWHLCTQPHTQFLHCSLFHCNAIVFLHKVYPLSPLLRHLTSVCAPVRCTFSHHVNRATMPAGCAYQHRSALTAICANAATHMFSSSCIAPYSRNQMAATQSCLQKSAMCTEAQVLCLHIWTLKRAGLQLQQNALCA